MTSKWTLRCLIQMNAQLYEWYYKDNKSVVYVSLDNVAF